MKNLGHERTTRTDRPDSVTEPLDALDGENLTWKDVLILAVCIAVGLFFGATVAHGYYLWLLK